MNINLTPATEPVYTAVDILGLGECMIALDSPRALESMALMTCEAAGDVYNTMVAASSMGARCGFVSRLAKDPVGQMILEACAQENIDTSAVKLVKDGVNGLYLTLHQEVPGNHAFVYYRKDSAASRISPQEVIESQVKAAKVVYATGISMALSPSAEASVIRLFELAKKHNVLVAFDPNYRPALWAHRDEALSALLKVLPYVDILLPSLEDLIQLFGMKEPAHLLEFFRYKDVPLVALKNGAEGITLAKGRKICHVDAVPTRVVDTVGAGDAFNGAFLASMLQNTYSLEQCAQIGAAAASACVGAKGPTRGLPTWDQLSNAVGRVSV